MVAISFCPSGEELQRFARGTLEAASAEHIIHHLHQCRTCLAALEGAPIEDTLIEALQTWGKAGVGVEKAAFEGLIQRLKKLAVGAAADPEATAADAPAAKAERFDFLSPPQAEGEIGRLGGYRVLQLLGSGGMGMVFAAEDMRLKRKAALKVMKPDLAANEGAKMRFLREAESCAAVRSDHVITIYQVGEQGDAPFLAMEYLEGVSLDDWLKKGRKPTLAQAARIGRQIALGLAAAHERGLIHRDIKPGNIWLESNYQGRVKLLDFGLARGTSEEVHLTQSGAIVGTPAFMAPEQARGEKVDHRCDLFSLGVVLYRLTTGQMPFRGDNTMSILTALALDKPTPPRQINADIPPRLATLIERLLAKEREQRPATAKAVADELAIIEREATQPATEDRTVQTEPQPVRRWLIAASLLLLLGGVAAAIVIIVRDPQGNKIAEIHAPKGSKVEIKDADKGAANRQRELPGDKIAAPPLSPMLPGTPLSPVALVQRPAKLPGVRSWSIESRNVYFPVAMTYSPDGKRLAVACNGGVFRIWEPESGRLVQMILEPDAVGAMAWSPDGRTLALGCRGKRPVRLFDAETGRFLRGLEAPAPGEGSALAWTDDGRKVRAKMHSSRECHTWNVADGKLLATVQIPSANHAFSPNGKQLAGHRADGRLTVWDAETGKEERTLGVSTSSLTIPVWSPKGDRLATWEDKAVVVWDIESGKQGFTHPLIPYGIAWSPDGTHLVYNRSDTNGAMTLKLEPGAKPEQLESGGVAVHAWSPDGKSIARLHDNNSLYLYDAASGKRLRSLSEGASSVSLLAFSPAGRMLALSEQSGKTFLSSGDTGQTVAVLKDTYGHLAWSPDGKTLAKGGPNHTIDLWDDGGQTRIILKGHQGNVLLLAWSPDGKRLVSYADGEMRMLLWDAAKGELLRELGPIPTADGNTRMTWSADGRFLAFRASIEKELGWHIWDVEQNKLVNNPKEWRETCLVFSPDSRSALVGSYGIAYRLRDCTTGKEGRSLPLTGSPWGSMPAWSPDGRLLAVPSLNWGVELWRGDLSRRVRTLPLAYPDLQQQIAFSPDGKWTFGRAGERLHVWETDTGRLSGILLLGEKNNGLTIAADGHYTGNDQVERGIVAVVQKNDGTQELLEPADFEQKYGWKNDPNKVHLLNPLPPPLYPLPGMPMGPLALVPEPAELPDANAMSWTVESVNSRGSVNAVAYRPDCKLLATGGADGTIRLWDAISGKLVRLLIGDPVGSLAWSKDGKVLTALRPGDIQGCEWDADTGRLLRHILGAVTPGDKTARSLDGKQTVTADDKGVRITDTATGKVLHALEDTVHINYLNCSWSPDGRRLAFAYQLPGEDGLHVVEAATGRPLSLSADYERAAVWSPDGKTLAVIGRNDAQVQLLDSASSRVVRTLEGQIGGGLGLAWSADGKLLAGAAHTSLHVWSLATGKQLWQSDKPANVVTWSPDGKKLASSHSSDKGAVRVWEAESGKLLREVPLQSKELAWSPDSKFLVAGPMDQGEALVIEANSGTVKFHLKDGVRGLACIRWSSDGKTFTTFSSEGTLRVWDAATGDVRRTTQLPGVVGHISSATWSPDGLMLAWASGDAIHLDGGTGEPLGKLMPLGPFAQLAVTADGHYRGNARVERLIRMVVQKADGTTETLPPHEFEQKYGFKNEPDKVRLIEK